MSSDASAPAIRVRNLTKEYQVYGRPYERLFQGLWRKFGSGRQFGFVVKAVNDVSFDLAAGQTLAVIGRNGSGKSTLLEMITGTLAPTSGAVELSGRVSALLELGAGFNPDFTGRENYRLNASILGLSDRQIEVTEPAVEAFAELGDFMDEPVRTYSSGMYVRLAFATAVHVEPEILIVDEALAVGDIFFQQKCFDFIGNELGHVTKLLVTHDLAMAAKLAERSIVLSHGDVIFDGDTLEAVEVFTAVSLRERSGSSSAGPADVGEDSEHQPLTGIAVPVETASSPELFRIVRIAAAELDPARGVSRELELDKWTCRPGRQIRVSCAASLGVSVDAPVIGYLVRDRVGNAVFGQNSTGSGITLEPMSPGQFMLEFTFPWPEVEPGDYTLTIGLGDGHHPHFHQIVGWAQGVAAMTSVPERPVHGMANNDLISLTVKRAN